MGDKIRITEQELQALLDDETTAEQALRTYFEIDDTQPFNPTYRLKPDVELVGTRDLEGFGPLGAIAVKLANAFMHHQRVARYKKMLEKEPNRLRLVSEGDSWFQHPLIDDTIDHLFNHIAVYSVGAAGDELRDMFKENEYKPAIQEQGAPGLLLSGGGNDLLGDRFGEWLNPYSPGDDPKRFLNDKFFAELDQIAKVYRTLASDMEHSMPQVKIFTHGYDYVVPGSGKKGKWLGKPMEEKGIVQEEDKRALAHFIIDEFARRMESLANEFANVEFIDMRGTVLEHQWYDEIHPDDHGFQQVSLKFVDRVNACFA